MKKNILKLSIILLLIAISNYYSAYITIFVDGLMLRYEFESKSGDFKYIAIPAKGQDVELMERHYDMYLKKNLDKKREKIYRTFRANPLKFWKWYFYLNSDLYNYPYKKTNTNTNE